MLHPPPFVREAGTGPTVICMHANASHSGQWSALMKLLANRFHVVAVESWGAGKSPEWPSDRVITLADEVELLAPVIARATSPTSIVAHSYSGAVALKAALLHPGRFGALALYEPTLFALVDRANPEAVSGIREAVRKAAGHLDSGDSHAAGRTFIDFWMGSGNWDGMPEERKPLMAASVRNVRRWAHALFTDPVTLPELASLDVPVLLLTGGRSPRSSLSVSELLARTLPRAEAVNLPRLGHMGPVTHPEIVNAQLERFLLEAAR